MSYKYQGMLYIKGCPFIQTVKKPSIPKGIWFPNCFVLIQNNRSKCEMFLMTYFLQSMDIWDFFPALKLPGYFLFEIKLLGHCWLVSWLVFISIKIIKYV